MKRIILSVLLALPLVMATNPASSRTPAVRVVIDPGHGGQNMGALGAYGVYEKYVTLSIALRLGRLLETEPGITVFYTRKDDVFVGLSERAELANALDADLFVSIHCNASEHRDPNGIETFFLGMRGDDPEADEVARRENLETSLNASARDEDLVGILEDLRKNGDQTEAATLAEVVQRRLTRAVPEAADRDVRQARFTVLEKARMPAVVVELGFITHPKEGLDLLLAPYQERLAMALRDAISHHAVARFAAPQRSAMRY